MGETETKGGGEVAVRAPALELSDRLERLQQALEQSELRYALASQGANDGLWDWNLLTDAIVFSPRWKGILGFSDHEIGNCKDEWFDRIHGEDKGRVQRELAAHLTRVAPHFQSEHRLLHKDGSYHWVVVRGLAAWDERGTPRCIGGSLTDTTPRKTVEAKILHDAFYDSLTGLPNRTLFMDSVERLLSQVRGEQERRWAVLTLDIDRFKVVNDSLGHSLGDMLLVEVARRLQTCVTENDTLARLGGDEFGLLVDLGAQGRDPQALASHIQKLVSEPIDIAGSDVFTTVSIGVAALSEHYDYAADVVRDAVTATFRAKDLGRARHVEFDSTMHVAAVAQMRLETDLRHALTRQEFELHYQPIVSLGSGHIEGLEALIRWHHPERQVGPMEFIPVAEETGLIVQMGAWVLGEACRCLKSLQAQHPSLRQLNVSVNVSGKQLVSNEIVEQVSRILGDTGLDPHTLQLEITETVLMRDTRAVNARLHDLRSLGLGLHLDDFGTGYSSLSMLHTFPIDTLKIDRSFVWKLSEKDADSAIIRAIISVARTLGLKVIAEGIETKAQLDTLRQLGVDYGQGYLFSKPIDCAGIEKLLAHAPAW